MSIWCEPLILIIRLLVMVLQVPHLYCIGDANGKMMLAHAASAQGISGESFYRLSRWKGYDIVGFSSRCLKVSL